MVVQPNTRNGRLFFALLRYNFPPSGFRPLLTWCARDARLEQAARPMAEVEDAPMIETDDEDDGQAERDDSIA